MVRAEDDSIQSVGNELGRSIMGVERTADALNPRSTCWDVLLQSHRDYPSERMAWRMMRQFHEPQECEREFGNRPSFCWQVAVPTDIEQADAVKLLLVNERGVRCESVVLLPTGRRAHTSERRPQRATACVSSQPGCGVGCPFCSTASLGYQGNLAVPEILEQVYWAGCIARRFGRSLRNVVFMGMGEPLHNSQALFESLRWLTSNKGFGLSPRHITVSTAGVPTAMLDLAQRFSEVRIALSLHSCEANLRRRLVPRAVGDLNLLRETIADINKIQRQPVWLEVVLFDQLNDSTEHAMMLLEFCSGLRVEVNLIPYNVAGNAEEFRASPKKRREDFASILRDAGIRTTIRQSLGADRDAACGQLACGKLPEGS